MWRYSIGNQKPIFTRHEFRITGIGVIGDSQSDEYRADDDSGQPYTSSTLNWVEILSQYRSVNFGEWGVREEPRRTGFAYNWARSGATAESLIINRQHVGIANQVKNKKINIVIVYIGANDFAPYNSNDYQALYKHYTYTMVH